MIERLTITVLVENQSTHPGLRTEHGLALWIEADEHRLLLDTGAGDALLPNATSLGIDLALAEALILSHGHCDHTGAVAAVLLIKPDLPVFFHPDALKPHFSLRNGSPRAIGMPGDAAAVLGANVTHSSRMRQVIAPGIWCSGEISRSAAMQPSDPALFCDANGIVPDPLFDDQALIIDTSVGLVVISGCCHAGVEATLLHVRKHHPERPFAAVVGGLHLKACDDAEICQHIAHVTQYDVPQIIAGHCTGAAGEALLAARSDLNFNALRGGDRWHLSEGRLQPCKT